MDDFSRVGALRLRVANGTWRQTFSDGAITDVKMLLACASYFALGEEQAPAVLSEVHAAVSNLRQVTISPKVGLLTAEVEDFAPTFEHEQMDAASATLRR